MADTELRPCPFCGCKPELFRGHQSSKVVCNTARCKVQPVGVKARTFPTAIAAWNHREPDPAYLTEMHRAANARADRAEVCARYWRQRAKSAEGHLWGSDHEAAERAVHAGSVLHDTPWDDLTNQQRWAVSRVVSATIAAINGRRHARLPKDAALAKVEGGGL